MGSYEKNRGFFFLITYKFVFLKEKKATTTIPSNISNGPLASYNNGDDNNNSDDDNSNDDDDDDNVTRSSKRQKSSKIASA